MTCAFPSNTPLSAYRKGCRCERCCAEKSLVDRRRDRTPKIPCPRCGGRKAAGAELCRGCRNRPAIDRLLEKIQIDSDTGCWLFTANRNAGGYGLISVNGRGRAAHCVSYAHFIGPVPEGLELDHLCSRPPCCNPDHLEPVTHQENVRRAVARRATAGAS